MEVFRRGMDGEHLRAKKERVCTFPESTLSISGCAHRTRRNFTLYLHSARRLVWSPLRASNECLFIWSISSIWFVWLIGLEIHSEEPERPANQTDEPGAFREQEDDQAALPLLLLNRREPPFPILDSHEGPGFAGFGRYLFAAFDEIPRFSVLLRQR